MTTKAKGAAWLLVDISNSFVKLVIHKNDVLGAVRRIATAKLTADTLAQTLKGWKYDRVVFCSVVPVKSALLHALLPAAQVLEVNHRTRLGIGIDYPKPSSIGPDRLVNAAGAAAIFGAPVVVVDFGTAVTFDIVSTERAYVGGVIAPGLQAMTTYLHERTALLPEIVLKEPPSAIGKSTRHAMLAGAVFGYRGLIERILKEVMHELGDIKKLPVVATGGYAELIADELPAIQTVDPLLTLRGLAIIAAMNA